MKIRQSTFGHIDTVEAALFELENDAGATVSLTNYGGTVVSLSVKDRDGKLDDVVLGFDTLEAYRKASPYFGCIVGRYGNRIARAKFTLEGVEYVLAANEGDHHLHGGIKAFDKVVWDAQILERDDAAGVKLTYFSRDGEEGYPGNLSCTVTYHLTNANELRIDYACATDKITHFNPTHHGYFNLAGHGAGNILEHELTLFAERFTPVDSTLIPTGELRAVSGTPMDFTRPRRVGDRIEEQDEQLVFAGGYDHNWVLNNQNGGLALAARVYEPKSGRVMEVLTTQPGIQFYTGNFLPDDLAGKQGRTYGRRGALCLETQHFPDSPNKPEFPSTILRPSGEYKQTTIYKFYSK